MALLPRQHVIFVTVPEEFPSVSPYSQSGPLTTCAPGKIPLARIPSVLILLYTQTLGILRVKQKNLKQITLIHEELNHRGKRASLMARVWLG